MKTLTKTLYRPQFGFSASRKKSKILTTRSKTMTSRPKKKEKKERETEILLREKQYKKA